ncbi:nucleotidyltransferase family protein [Trichocoleus sp. ST-U3]
MKARCRTSLRSPAFELLAIALLNLPNWWLAGGAVRNMVWR